jgi:hypothetical protein
MSDIKIGDIVIRVVEPRIGAPKMLEAYKNKIRLKVVSLNGSSSISLSYLNGIPIRDSGISYYMIGAFEKVKEIKKYADFEWK